MAYIFAAIKTAWSKHFIDGPVSRAQIAGTIDIRCTGTPALVDWILRITGRVGWGWRTLVVVGLWRLFFLSADFFLDDLLPTLLDGDHLALLIRDFGRHHHGVVTANFFAGGLWHITTLLSFLVGTPLLHLQFSVRRIDHPALLLETGVAAAIEAAESKGIVGRPLAST